MNLSRDEIELLIRGLDVIDDEYSGTSQYDPVPIEALRQKLEAMLVSTSATDTKE